MLVGAFCPSSFAIILMRKRELFDLLELSFLMSCDSQCSMAGGLVCDENFFVISCADPESFARGGPTMTPFVLFLFFRREDPSTAISGPSSAR